MKHRRYSRKKNFGGRLGKFFDMMKRKKVKPLSVKKSNSAKNVNVVKPFSVKKSNSAKNVNAVDKPANEDQKIAMLNEFYDDLKTNKHVYSKNKYKTLSDIYKACLYMENMKEKDMKKCRTDFADTKGIVSAKQPPPVPKRAKSIEQAATQKPQKSMKQASQKPLKLPQLSVAAPAAAPAKRVSPKQMAAAVSAVAAPATGGKLALLKAALAQQPGGLGNIGKQASPTAKLGRGGATQAAQIKVGQLGAGAGAALEVAATGNLSKYTAMLKVGLPPGAVRNAMLRDGFPENKINDFLGKSPKPAATLSAANIKSAANANGANLSKKQADIVASTVATQAAAAASAGGAPSTAINKNIKGLEKYAKMLAVGLPDGAVENKMIQDGISGGEIARFFNRKYEVSTQGPKPTLKQTIAANKLKNAGVSSVAAASKSVGGASATGRPDIVSGILGAKLKKHESPKKSTITATAASAAAPMNEMQKMQAAMAARRAAAAATGGFGKSHHRRRRSRR